MAIQFKRKTTTGAPTAGDILQGEIAINFVERTIYTKDNNNNIITIGGGIDSVESVNGQTGVVVINTDDISEGLTNLYYTSARFDASFATKTTSDLTEGTNLYYTEPRATANFNSNITGVNTDAISEGSTNLYYTNVRADARIQAAIQDGSSTATTLYSSQKIDSLISGSLQYKGAWDATTNTPTLSDGTGSQNDYYKVSVAGDRDLGSGTISFQVGDDVIHNGTSWERFGSSNAVDSVNGKVGAVVLSTDDISEGATNLYYTDTRVDIYVNTLGFTKIDDSDPTSIINTYSASKIESIVAEAEEVDDTASTASTTKTWSINKINANYMPINVDFGFYS